MNMELMFDLATNLAEMRTSGKPREEEYNIGGKIRKISFDMQQKLLNREVQAFMHEPAIATPSKKQIQAFAGSSDLPKLATDVFTIDSWTQDFDLGWQRAFRGVPLRTGQLSWEIATVESGISFKLIPEGGKVEYGDIAGEKVTADIKKYGAGLGVTWEIITGRKLYQFVQIMEDARAALYALWADIHYGLLATASLNNQIAYQGAGTDRVIDRDIATFNAGATAIRKANKDKGYGNMANARLLFYVSNDLESRVLQALNATPEQMRAAEGNGDVVTSSIEPVFTYDSNIPSNRGLLILPGNKIQNAVYMQEMGLSKQDIDSLNELRTYWTAFGAIVADTDQCYELAFA